MSRSRIERLMKDYKPYIDEKWHYILDKNVEEEVLEGITERISFVCFLIFAVWFCSRMCISFENIEWSQIYKNYSDIPFHSFLIHIRNGSNGSNGSLSFDGIWMNIVRVLFWWNLNEYSLFEWFVIFWWNLNECS